MQIKKEEIRASILLEAKREFAEKGFQKASLRSIASRVNITHSNIYNYFKNKDMLFREIMKPVLFKMEEGKKFLFIHETTPGHKDEESHFEIIDGLLNYVHQNRELLKILLFNSSGSSLESLKDEATDWITELFKDFVLVQKNSGYEVAPISDFIIHNISAMWVNFVTEILMHDISYEQMLKDGKTMMSFMFFGWQKLLNHSHS